MFTTIAIVIAVFVGAWAGIGFETFIFDATYGYVERFSYYAKMPWQTVKNVWALVRE